MEGGVQVLMEHINSEFLLLAFKIFLSAVAVLFRTCTLVGPK